YALGAVLFELVTGRMVFEATSSAHVVAMHLYEQPRSARSIEPSLPPRLDALIARMLAKDPAQRPTLAEVRAEILACRDLPAAPPRRRWVRLLVVGGAVAVAVGLGIFALTRDDSSPAPAPAPPRAPRPPVAPAPP